MKPGKVAGVIILHFPGFLASCFHETPRPPCLRGCFCQMTRSPSLGFALRAIQVVSAVEIFVFGEVLRAQRLADFVVLVEPFAEVH